MANDNLSRPDTPTKKEIKEGQSMVTSSRGGRDEKPQIDMSRVHHECLWCRSCLAVFKNKEWVKDPALLERIRGQKELESICPACKQKKMNVAEGIVYLSNVPSGQKKEELLSLIQNENKKSRAQDAEDRILEIKDKGSEMEIWVSDNQFATRLGKKINSAFKGGKKEIKFSRFEDATRVYVTLPPAAA